MCMTRIRTANIYVAIGMSLADSGKLLNNFTLLIIGLVPLVILTGCAMGWIFAGRALTPVLEIARTAQRISGSNLSLRIPARGAGDELDRLIETFNQMIERIEVNFNQVRQFSTDVSHELRTPITVVRGQLEVALVYRANRGPVSRRDRQFPGRYRAPLANRARPPAPVPG